ncbi:hypothetical protein SKAU_G00118150 [Synaphobranchus kaupii]|uniref:C-type lectin domain-containing protein n=1 Tax=Synaphobranchus kaupii TaxID=118154 RepID=A0A9Q1FNB9_SYNKA|nr:hypothetical protein SKAU_G00118150 [Synaphobranchus kaupii]
MINSQEKKNKDDLLQNIQNVEENINAKIVEQMNNLRSLWQLGSQNNSSWKRFGSKLYYFSQTSEPWEKAREQCVAMGATLAMVKTDEQMAFLANESTSKHWLGLSDIGTEGTWKWLDGSIPDKRLWVPGEPNNEGEEDCGEIHGRLNDIPCDLLRPWVCEKSIAI